MLGYSILNYPVPTLAIVFFTLPISTGMLKRRANMRIFVQNVFLNIILLYKYDENNNHIYYMYASVSTDHY